MADLYRCVRCGAVYATPNGICKVLTWGGDDFHVCRGTIVPLEPQP